MVGWGEAWATSEWKVRYIPWLNFTSCMAKFVIYNWKDDEPQEEGKWKGT